MRVNWYHLFFISTIPKQSQCVPSPLISPEVALPLTLALMAAGPGQGAAGGPSGRLCYEQSCSDFVLLSCPTSQRACLQCHIHSTADRTGSLIPFTQPGRKDPLMKAGPQQGQLIMVRRGELECSGDTRPSVLLTQGQRTHHRLWINHLTKHEGTTCSAVLPVLLYLICYNFLPVLPLFEGGSQARIKTQAC